MPFALPTDGSTYIDQIITRCKDLINYNVWQGLDELQLDIWLNNFSCDKQRYFAARLLDVLIYLSEPQTKSMLTHLFQRTIGDLARTHNFGSFLQSTSELLQSEHEPHIRVVPVTPDRHSATASGPLLTRLARRHLNIRKKWIISARRIRSNASFVVFLDDFIGTGNQFSRFLRHNRLAHLIEERRCCYLSIAAHSSGINNLRREFPGLAVSAVDLLTEQNSLFDEQSLAFPDGTNCLSDAMSFYREMLKSFHIRPRYKNGYGGLNVAYAFSHSVPNNSTPLLWWPKNSNWTPLFVR